MSKEKYPDDLNGKITENTGEHKYFSEENRTRLIKILLQLLKRSRTRKVIIIPSVQKVKSDCRLYEKFWPKRLVFIAGCRRNTGGIYI